MLKMFLVLQIRVLCKIIFSYGFEPRKRLFDVLQYDALFFVYESVWRYIRKECNILTHLLKTEVFVAKHFNRNFYD
jgi:hypothetical protein